MKPGVLLTRNHQQNEHDRHYLDEQMYEVYSIPLIETEGLGIIQETSFLREFDWLFFTSSNAVKYFWQSVPDKTLLAKKKIAVIGEKTAEKVHEFGLTVDFMPTQYSSPIFIKEWLKTFGNNQQLKVLLPKSDLARSNIQAAIVAKGVAVTEQVIYRNRLPERSQEELQRLLSAGVISIAIFSCPSAWQRFVECSYTFDQSAIRYGAIGPVTQAEIEKSGHVALIPADGTYTMKSLLQRLT